jgi:tetratricopeptide (TPR) repeat protein
VRAQDLLVEARLVAAGGELERALELLERRLREDPADAAALVLKGGFLVEARRDEEGLDALREAVRIAPRSAAARNGLARALHSLGRDDEALAHARQALSLLGEGENFRETAPVYLTLVWCLREQRRWREALALAEEGLARCPDAVLAQWASVVEEELAEAEKERC